MAVTVITNLNSHQIDQLVTLYSGEFWCNKRSRSDVDKMLINSDIVFGACAKSFDLVGFVRVLTDYTYKAIIFDLIVHPAWRGNNIGKLLMDAVINHPELQKVEHFDLNCMPKMYKFYEKWGFTSDIGELGFMRKFNKALKSK